MKSSAIFLVALAALICARAEAAPRVVLPTNAVPLHYDLAIVPDEAHLTFAGTVKIDLLVKTPSKSIVLNAADLAFDRVSMSGAAQPPAVSYDVKEQTARLTFPAEISAGRHRLAIAYRGKIYRQAAGLFALDYAAGKTDKRALFTQFENSDARRFLPCWDEPDRKATFTLTATVPAEDMAISNTPIASQEPVPGGLKRVTFQTSPKMSSYLLFFGLGDFERVSRTVNGVEVGIVVKRGDGQKAAYALDAAAHILPYYEDYFGVKYPLPKLDLIAGPGASQFFSAMENWGAIFYFERALEIDPKVSTEEDRRRVYLVIAHEMAHQWFGDLVTMDWWDDLWLNEGFASWMELKATDRFHPEWKVWLDSLGAKERAMDVDARAGTHPIVTPIVDVLQANQAFDTITYSKGQAVIRMLENYVGADVWRAGVRRYIKAHAYGNTVTDDLWRAVDAVSPRPITQIAHDFTLQPGVPLIRAARAQGGVRLVQDRFAMDESASRPLAWRVPVLARPLGAQAIWRGVVSRGAPALVAGKDGAIVNAGQAGYFRTLYDPSLFGVVTQNFRALAPADELGLLNDAEALGYSGYEPLENFLGLAGEIDPSSAPQVQIAVAQKLEALDDLYRGLPGRAGFRLFARRLLNPLFAKVGWDARPAESQNAALLRAALLSALSSCDDPATIAQARRRFAAYLQDRSRLSGDARRSVLKIVARHADEATWEELHRLARAETNTLANRELYDLLGSAEDKELAGKALAVAQAGEPAITTRPSIVSAVAEEHPDLAFDFVEAHLDLLDGWLEADSRNQFAPRIAGQSFDPKMIARLKAFTEAHIPPTARNAATKAESAIAFHAKVRALQLPAADRWIAGHHA
ncbi:MAG TPA: M1 family metallopeptidase [Rhizomicrobium sp.]|nr:M1 family metallopeptidase [Rhizomicrobium sp.]